MPKLQASARFGNFLAIRCKKAASKKQADDAEKKEEREYAEIFNDVAVRGGGCGISSLFGTR